MAYTQDVTKVDGNFVHPVLESRSGFFLSRQNLRLISRGCRSLKYVNFKGVMAVLNNCEAFQSDSYCVLVDDPALATSCVKIADSVFKNSVNGIVINKNDSRVGVDSDIFKSFTGGNIINLQSSPYLSDTDNLYW